MMQTRIYGSFLLLSSFILSQLAFAQSTPETLIEQLEQGDKQERRDAALALSELGAKAEIGRAHV